MSAQAFCRYISGFCETLVSQELALDMQAHRVFERSGRLNRVTWVASVMREEHSRTDDLELSEYLRCIRCGDYSLMLNDGSLIQVLVDFCDSEVIANRFCFIPCPVAFTLDDLRLEGGEMYPVEDFIRDLSQEELLERMCIRPPFRFELDPENKKPEHPLSHVHLGRSSTRVPVVAPMCWDHFARFIFMNFYPEIFVKVTELLRFPPPYRPVCIEEAHKLEVHFAFTHAL